MPSWHFAALDTPLDFAALDSRHPYTLFLAQARTEALLAERADELGVRIHRGHTLTGLRQNEDGVEAQVRGRPGTRDTFAPRTWSDATAGAASSGRRPESTSRARTRP